MLDQTPEDGIEQRDLYDRPPSVTKSWSNGPVTLMGDAVHPMMPNLGQGGGQAIEDAYVRPPPTSSTLNPQPSTLNPQPSTLNPQPPP